MTRLSIAAALAVLALAPSTGNAGVTWSDSHITSPTSGGPAISKLTGGPATLASGTASNLCANGATNFSANPTATAFQPYYFPMVIGSGSKLVGYFNYRPIGSPTLNAAGISEGNEITVAATSNDAGANWTYAGAALQASASCPGANDAGLGHPYVMSLGGSTLLYLLDRRGGYIDNSGLVVKRLVPTAAAPLTARPALNTTIAAPTSQSNGATVIAGWDFSNYGNTAVTNKTVVNNPIANLPSVSAASLVNATAKALGMDNSYPCTAYITVNGNPVLAEIGKSSTNSDDIQYDSGASVTDANGKAYDWRVRNANGSAKTSAASSNATCNGWSNYAPEKTQGAEFDVSTVGQSKVAFSFDWFTTNQGVNKLQVQYNLNRSVPGSWTDIGPVYTAVANGFAPNIYVDFTNVAGAGNNPNFGVRVVSVADPSVTVDPNLTKPLYLTASSTGTPPSTAYGYGGASGGGYNNNSGNWRFANVLFTVPGTGSTAATAANDYKVETLGLKNPDGIVAVIPGSYPRTVLYVQKRLNSIASGSSGDCAVAGNSGKINYDQDTVNVAHTYDGVNFVDDGTTNLTNTTDTYTTKAQISAGSGLGIRYAAPNGSIIKLGNGRYGLFIGVGNCVDGDSDGFHAIVYAETTDPTFKTWTYVNDLRHPIAAVSYDTFATTPPVIGTSVSGGSSSTDWFSGRVYNPQAIKLDSTHVSLIFAGYNQTYGTASPKDLSNYRTIGHVVLTSDTNLP